MAKWVKINETVNVSPKNGTDYSLSELQGFVGGHIEILQIGDEFLMVLNEEGKIEGLEFNSIATSVAHHAGAIYDNDYIVGDVLICLKGEIK